MNPPIINFATVGSQLETFTTQLSAWAAIAVPNIAIALFLFVAGFWIAGRAQRAVARVIASQSRIDATLTTIVSTLVRYGILVLVAVAVLGQLGIQTTSILAALGAIGLAVGLAMQGTLSNVAAGVMLIWLRPFKVGDQIEAGPIAGTVREVGLFATEMHSGDGVFLFVPNAQLWNVRVANLSRLPTRQVDLRFGVSYGDDLAKGRAALIELANKDRRVRQEPKPAVFVDTLGDSAVSLGLRVWTSSSDHWNVRCDLMERGKEALESAGLTLPFPQRDVHLYNAPKACDAKAA